MTFNNREMDIKSTFNQQWREILIRLVQVIEML
jgi:hypothetical protein